MAILILNITGNRSGFENKFCDNLGKKIGEDVIIKNIKGLKLMEEQIIDDGYDVVVIVAHAGLKGEFDTVIETGLAGDCEPVKSIVDSPTILAQVLEKNPQKHFLVYCACKAFSAETFVSGVHDPNCIGVVASKTAIYDDQIDIIAEVVCSLRDHLKKGDTDLEVLSKVVRKTVEKNGGEPNLYYYEVPRVSELGEEE